MGPGGRFASLCGGSSCKVPQRSSTVGQEFRGLLTSVSLWATLRGLATVARCVCTASGHRGRRFLVRRRCMNCVMPGRQSSGRQRPSPSEALGAAGQVRNGLGMQRATAIPYGNRPSGLVSGCTIQREALSMMAVGSAASYKIKTAPTEGQRADAGGSEPAWSSDRRAGRLTGSRLSSISVKPPRVDVSTAS